jgi:hypothetical protein
MKETANGLPYPEDTDAPDAPTQIKALAEAIDQIPSALIADLAIIAAKIASEAVETGKIKNLAVTAAKLAEAAVTEGKLGGESVSSAKIKALAVTAAKIAEEAIETGKIKALAVTAAKLAADSVTSTKIAANAVEEAKVKDGAITSRKAKLTADVVEASGDLALTGAYQDVPGASLDITPAVASKLKVTAVWDLYVKGQDTSGVLGAQALGTLSIDGEDQSEQVEHGIEINSGFFGVFATRGIACQVYAIPLTAAKHTLKMRAKRGGPQVTEGKCFKLGTRFLYELIAA